MKHLGIRKLKNKTMSIFHIYLPCPSSGQVKEQDNVFNYVLSMLPLGLFLMQLNDIEQEGDGERMMRNWKLLMLYARSRGRSKKYAFEAMRLLTYCKALLTETMAHKITQGQFVNPKGGPGNNYANDRKQEHLVKCNKYK